MKSAAHALLTLLSVALGTAVVAGPTTGPAASPNALPISAAAIDRTVARAMQSFNVPGMAIGIVKDWRLIYAKGYGVRELGKPAPVDIDTLFQIGSNTKAFTAAALAILVDEHKIRWDDKVIDTIPEFRLYDPYVTREFTLRDLLSHRSGLGTGAGDLMFYPNTDFSRAEMIRGLRYLKPVSSFRSQYAYDNLLYMVAGQVVATVSGQTWDEFVTQRVLQPLRMNGCVTSYRQIAAGSNTVTPHVMSEGKLTAIKPIEFTAISPAGAISCNVSGMAKWLQTQLNAGKSSDGTQIFTADRGEEMWTPNTVMPLSPVLASVTHTHFEAYGFGWDLQDEFGYKRVSHTGGVPGTVTWVTMIPELRLGIVVLTNQQEGAAMEAVGNQILDAYVGAPKRDWIAIGVAYKEGRDREAMAVETEVATVLSTAGAPPPFPLAAYAGRYRDPWRGDADIRLEAGKLVLKFSRTEGLEGTLTPFEGNVFIVRWHDRSLNADAYVRFSQAFRPTVGPDVEAGDDRPIERDNAQPNGKSIEQGNEKLNRKPVGQPIAGMTLQAISPLTDFSFDFQDLDFAKLPADSQAP
jgi:CubicO group peptidase (beta-lactamase class C family)